MLSAIWYHSYGLKNVKNTRGEVLLSVMLSLLFNKVADIAYNFIKIENLASLNFPKSNTPSWVF